MNDLIAFQFENKPIRTIDEDGTIWFVLSDVLKALDTKSNITQVSQSLKNAFQESKNNDIIKKITSLNANGRSYEIALVSEAAVTYLISVSRTETAKRMNTWLHFEVIPSIRKTGSYSIAPQTPTATPNELILMIAQANIETERRINAIDLQLEQVESNAALIDERLTAIEARPKAPPVKLMNVFQYLMQYYPKIRLPLETHNEISWQANRQTNNLDLPSDRPFGAKRRECLYTKRALDVAFGMVRNQYIKKGKGKLFDESKVIDLFNPK